MIRPLLLVAPLVILIGCSSPVGTYRVDSSSVLEASCSGVDPVRVGAWVDALSAAPASDMQVGMKGGEIQAQLQRDDSSVLYASVIDSGNNTWSGSRSLESTTTSDALLGADFSALLENEGVCRFDLTVEADLNFGEEGFDGVNGQFRATLDETSGAEPCDIQSCTALIAVGAGRTSSVNPGIQSEEEAE